MSGSQLDPRRSVSLPSSGVADAVANGHGAPLKTSAHAVENGTTRLTEPGHDPAAMVAAVTAQKESEMVTQDGGGAAATEQGGGRRFVCSLSPEARIRHERAAAVAGLTTARYVVGRLLPDHAAEGSVVAAPGGVGYVFTLIADGSTEPVTQIVLELGRAEGGVERLALYLPRDVAASIRFRSVVPRKVTVGADRHADRAPAPFSVTCAESDPARFAPWSIPVVADVDEREGGDQGDEGEGDDDAEPDLFPAARMPSRADVGVSA